MTQKNFEIKKDGCCKPSLETTRIFFGALFYAPWIGVPVGENPMFRVANPYLLYTTAEPAFPKSFGSECHIMQKAGFRIRIDLMRIRIRIRIQHFF